MIRKILFPIDFSGVSPGIVPCLLLMGNKFEAETNLLFVARSFEHLAGVYVSTVSIENFQTEFTKGAETKIEESANTYFTGYPNCKTKVTFGDAAEEILAHIKKEKIDLVVMGTHGRKGLERIVFGSVAERVIQMSPTPALSIHPPEISTA